MPTTQYQSAQFPGYSVILEDDGRVAYAYLLLGDEIVGDVWLYNRLPPPATVNWREQTVLPFLNPMHFLRAEASGQVMDAPTDVDVRWWQGEKEEVCIVLEGEITVVLQEGQKPGWSNQVAQDGPLAKCLRDLTEAWTQAIDWRGETPTSALVDVLRQFSSAEGLQLDWDQQDGEEWGSFNKEEEWILMFHHKLPLVFVREKEEVRLRQCFRDAKVKVVVVPVENWEVARYRLELGQVRGIVDWREGVSPNCFSIQDLYWATV